MSSNHVVISALVIAAFAFIAYICTRKKQAKFVDVVDTQFVLNWISLQDMENYSESYCAVMIRGKELERMGVVKKSKKNMLALALFDKKSQRIISRDLFIANEIRDFGDDAFVEISFS